MLSSSSHPHFYRYPQISRPLIALKPLKGKIKEIENLCEVESSFMLINISYLIINQSESSSIKS
jgi:hypothetical protein